MIKKVKNSISAFLKWGLATVDITQRYLMFFSLVQDTSQFFFKYNCDTDKIIAVISFRMY